MCTTMRAHGVISFVNLADISDVRGARTWITNWPIYWPVARNALRRQRTPQKGGRRRPRGRRTRPQSQRAAEDAGGRREKKDTPTQRTRRGRNFRRTRGRRTPAEPEDTGGPRRTPTEIRRTRALGGRVEAETSSRGPEDEDTGSEDTRRTPGNPGGRKRTHKRAKRTSRGHCHGP